MGLEACETKMRGLIYQGGEHSGEECMLSIATTQVLSLDRCVLSWHDLAGGFRSGMGSDDGLSAGVERLQAAEAQSAKETT